MTKVESVKSVDEIISVAPNAITVELMKKLFEEFNIDCIIHEDDDPCVVFFLMDLMPMPSRRTPFANYQQIKRAKGISSTDLMMIGCCSVRERGQLRSSWKMMDLDIAFLIFFLLLAELFQSPMASFKAKSVARE